MNNYSNLDLINVSWAVDDFRNCSFRITDPPKDSPEDTQVFYQRIQNPFLTRVAAGKAMLAQPLNVRNDGLMNRITETFDKMVKAEIEKEIEEMGGLAGVAKIKEIERQKEVLNRLEANLQAHNDFIKEYNSQYSSKCKTHEQTLGFIRAWSSTLSDDNNQLALVTLNDKIKQMNASLTKKETTNWQTLFSSYFSFNQVLKNLNSPEQAEVYRDKYQQLINQSYLLQLSSDLKKHELPFLVQTVFSTLGFDQKAIDGAIDKAMKEKPIEAFIKKEQLSGDPFKFKSQIQRKIFFLIGKELNINNKKRKKLNLILNVLNNVESRVTHLYDKALNQAKKGIGEELYRFEEQATLDLDHYYPKPEYEERGFKSALKNLNQVMGYGRKEFSAYLKKLENQGVEFEKNQEKNLNLQAGRLEKNFLAQHSTKKDLWKKRNKIYQNFSFNQSQWGLQQVLNEGACAAINYRWIRELLKDPIKKIKSFKDLDPDAIKSEERNPLLSSILKKIKETEIEKSPAIEFAREQLRKREGILSAAEMEEFEVEAIPSSPFLTKQDSSIGVKPEDRWIQASTMGGFRETGYLKKDHMQIEFPIDKTFPTIGALIDDIWDKDKKDPSLFGKSSGIFEISIFRIKGQKKDEDGHSLGMQIDRASGIYRFWDVNSGFYSYPNFETLKRETEAYMHEFYGKDESQGTEYNQFFITQYIKQIK